jgi:Right handed beta helix region
MAKTASLVAATLAAVCLHISTADAAGLNRAWVSGKGTDASGCGAPTSPCRTFQYVHDNIIAAGGEIDVLDPAGYGPVTITKALSIVNDGVGTAGVQASSGNAVTINAGQSDAVTLRGLNIDGLGTGSTGLQINSGAGLAIDHCVIRHFTNGIVISPSSGTTIFSMSDSFSLDNSSIGLLFHPTGSGSVLGRLVRDELRRNSFGLLVEGDSTTAFAASKVVVSETSANDNRSDGFSVSGGATLTLTRSISTGNFNGIGQYNGANNQVGVLQSYGDNRFVGDFQLNAPQVVMLSGN